MISAPMTASHQKASMTKLRPSGSEIHSVSCRRKALTMKVNSPSVRTIAGKARNFAMGFTTALTSPKIRATRMIVVKFEAKVVPSSARTMPSTSQAATHSATALIAVLIRKLVMPPACQVRTPRGEP